MAAFFCIMVANTWWFCPKCRQKLRAVEPSVHCWATPEEERDIKENHLYSHFASMPDYAIPQIHQPQLQADDVLRP